MATRAVQFEDAARNRAPTADMGALVEWNGRPWRMSRPHDVCRRRPHTEQRRSPDGQLHSAVPIGVAFTAVNRDRTWLVQDERAHFRTPATGGSHDGGR